MEGEIALDREKKWVTYSDIVPYKFLWCIIVFMGFITYTVTHKKGKKGTIPR